MSTPDFVALPLSEKDQQMLRRVESGEALMELADHSLLSFAGADALSYLHTKVTADTRRWKETGGNYGIATNINGQTVFDAHFRMHGDKLLALLEPGQLEGATAHLERFIIMEDVTLDDVSTKWRVFVRAGSDEAGVALSESRVFGTDVLRTRIDWPDATATCLFVPSESVEEFRKGAEASGVVIGEERHWQAWTLRHGIALSGADLVIEQTIPLESGSWHGVSLNKGCYLGQEVIERLFSRGRANKRLMRIALDGPQAPTRELSAEGKSVGWITRWTHDEVGAGVLAHAYIRRKYLGGDFRFDAGGRSVTVKGYVGSELPASP